MCACVCVKFDATDKIDRANGFRLHKKISMAQQEQEQNKPTENRNYFANQFIDTVIYLA